MKSTWFILFLLASNLMQAQQTTSVFIRMEPDKEFLYWLSGTDYLSDYELGFARSEKAKTDSAGYWTKTFAANRPVTLNIAKANKTIMTVLPLRLAPDGCDTVVLDNGAIRFRGTHAEYNRCLSETESFLDYCNRMLVGKPRGDSLFLTLSYPEFIRLLNGRKTQAQVNVKQYAGLDTAFVAEQLAHIELGSRMAFAYKVLFHLPDSSYAEDWKRAAAEAAAQPVHTPCFPSFRETYFFLSGLLGLKSKVETGGVAGKNMSFENFELLPAYMQGRNLECAWATLICNDIAYKTYDPIATELYDRLKARFPENTYRLFLEAGIQENLRFNAIDPADGSHSDYPVLACDSAFRCLADAVQSLRGKVVYVDMWATWCSSCLSEFPYLRQVQQRTKDLDVAFLFVSVDKPENKTRWEKSFRHYKLKGYHLLASPALTEAIYREYGNYIPHAVIFDKDGKVAERNAPELKQSEQVYEHLARWCK